MKKKRQEEIKEAGRRRRKEGEEKQFENAALCCNSFWPEYRNVSRRISSISGW